MSKNNSRLIKVETIPSTELLSLLERNVIGTPGQSMCYQHGTVKEKLSHIASPHFVNLTRAARLIGTSCFCQRMTTSNKTNWNSFYIRYFSFDARYRRSISARQKRRGNEGKLRAEMEDLFGQFAKDKSLPTLFYAYVDAGNSRSVDLTESFGFEKIGSLQSILFSRMYPKRKNLVTKMTADERGLVRSELKDYYRDHVLYTDENIFLNDNYFVIRHRGEIVAGLQANPDQWKVSSLPGLMGRLLPVFPYLPFINKLFNPSFKFLGVEGVFVKEGKDQYLESLIEGVLAHFDRNTALVGTDSNGKLNAALKSLELGLLHKINKPSTIDVIARFQNQSDDEKKGIIDAPVYISTFDIT